MTAEETKQRLSVAKSKKEELQELVEALSANIRGIRAERYSVIDDLSVSESDLEARINDLGGVNK